jgi:RNA polymerase sigma-70 factor (ECF subfamily)
MEHTPPFDAERLLAHRDWIRALARTLVSDASRADDLAQEAWIAAHARPPRDVRNLRAWLAEVVRNLARTGARAESRRARREQFAARSEALPDTTELVAQAELQRELVGHVLELDEPYRSVVLLRYFQDLEVSEIAEQLGAPANTVRTRLQRALAQLRERLDREWGARSTWCASLVTLARGAKHTTVPSTAAVLAATTAWKVAVIVVLGASAVWWYRSRQPEPTNPSIQVADRDPSSIQAPTSSRAGSAEGSTQPSSRQALATPSGTSATPGGSTALSTRTFEGRMVDVRGNPMRDLRVKPRYYRVNPLVPLLGESSASTTTDSSGRFHLDVPGDVREIEVAGWSFVSDGWRENPREHIYIVAPAVDIAGVVSDSSGLPVASVHVERWATRRGLRDFPWTLEGGNDDIRALAVTDDHGRFQLGVIPFVPGEQISAGRMGGPGTVVVPIPERSRSDLSIVIGPARRDERPRVRGLVLDDAGRPVSGAQVDFSNDEATSDENGRFELAVSNYDEDAALSATLPGRAAAVIDGFGQVLRDRKEAQQRTGIGSADVDEVILRLGGQALTIAGRIVDATGKPCAGWKVDLQDRTPRGNSSMCLEAVTAGHRTDHDFPVTDANGAFTIEGLRDRKYRVRAFDERTCLVLVSDPVDAGTSGLEMRVPNDAFRPRVRGRVVSSSGAPVSGAHVALVRIQVRIRSMRSWATCREVTAGADGRFELLDVPRREMLLSVSGVHVKGGDERPIPEDVSGDDLEIAVTLVCRLRVELAAGEPAEAFEIRDAKDKTMVVRTQRSNVISYCEHVQREPQGFPVCEVDDTARTLVLFQGKKELRRVPIELHPGDLQIITP